VGAPARRTLASRQQKSARCQSGGAGAGCRLAAVTCSLRHSLEGLSWLQRLIWPLIFAQLTALKRWVRAHDGRGVPYRVDISPFGKVALVRMPMDAAMGQTAAAAFAMPHFEFRVAPARAIFGLACTPECTPPAPPPEADIHAVRVWTQPCPVSPDPSWPGCLRSKGHLEHPAGPAFRVAAAA
jgi:hypothetical protein